MEGVVLTPKMSLQSVTEKNRIGLWVLGVPAVPFFLFQDLPIISRAVLLNLQMEFFNITCHKYLWERSLAPGYPKRCTRLPIMGADSQWNCNSSLCNKICKMVYLHSKTYQILLEFKIGPLSCARRTAIPNVQSSTLQGMRLCVKVAVPRPQLGRGQK